MVLTGSALVAVCSHISVPLWFTPVPLTLQPFAVLLLGLVADMIQRRSYDLTALLFPILLTALLYGGHLTRFQDAVRYDQYLLLLLAQSIGSDE